MTKEELLELARNAYTDPAHATDVERMVHDAKYEEACDIVSLGVEQSIEYLLTCYAIEFIASKLKRTTMNVDLRNEND